MYMSSPVVVGDTVYGFTHRNKGQFFALDVKTGATRWTSPPRQSENASITAAGGRLWCLTTDGALIVLKADPAAYAEVGRLDVAPSATWASPVLLGPQILVKDVDTCGWCGSAEPSGKLPSHSARKTGDTGRPSP